MNEYWVGMRAECIGNDIGAIYLLVFIAMCYRLLEPLV